MGEAYYRAQLIDEVLSRMPGNWIFGLGTTLVSVWFVSYEDICNNWLIFLVRVGLPGFLGLVLFYALMIWSLRECYVLLHSFRGERIFLWGLFSILISIIASWFFIALYGSDIGIFSSFFGLVVSLPQLAQYSLSGKADPDRGLDR